MSDELGFSDLFGEEEFSSQEGDDNFDIFGDEEFGDDLNSSVEDFDVFGDEEFEFSDFDVFDGEEFIGEEAQSKSNMSEWLKRDGNPELINLNVTNPNNTIFFRDTSFDYDKDYSDIRMIFERFRQDLMEGE